MSNISTNPELSFNMPESNVQLSANFERVLYDVTINTVAALEGADMSLYGQGKYYAGDTVTIKSTGDEPADRIKNETWNCSDENITIPDGTKTVFTFTMPANPVSFNIGGDRAIKLLIRNYRKENIPDEIYWHTLPLYGGYVLYKPNTKYLPAGKTWTGWELISGSIKGDDKGADFDMTIFSRPVMVLIFTDTTDIVIHAKLVDTVTS